MMDLLRWGPLQAVPLHHSHTSQYCWGNGEVQATSFFGSRLFSPASRLWWWKSHRHVRCHVRHGSNPECRHHSFSLPRSKVLPMLTSPLIVALLIWTLWSVSLRFAFYHRFKLLTGNSVTVGMSVLSMWNLWSIRFLLTMDMLLDLLVLNLIRAHLIFDRSFSSSCFVQATVDVRVVMPSM